MVGWSESRVVGGSSRLLVFPSVCRLVVCALGFLPSLALYSCCRKCAVDSPSFKALAEENGGRGRAESRVDSRIVYHRGARV